MTIVGDLSRRSSRHIARHSMRELLFCCSPFLKTKEVLVLATFDDKKL